MATLVRKQGTVTVHPPEAEGSTLTADATPLAISPQPHTLDMGVEPFGMHVTKSGIDVDEHLRTAAAIVVYGSGRDAITPLTQMAAYQGRLAATNGMGKSREADDRLSASRSYRCDRRTP